ncbi:glycosyltransferase involved in cell wall biosynthesis [Sphingomonas naasensis]|uniref:Glycosyltransferase n=1 Tax=Sphingomonas naasensis TaxID=1344951 RepID=A0A4S1W5N0_9SPHN|nr:glycosyltransferase family 2 protein [Sphingomonas naasensis]NIJ20025.1 glycosyltransferase involved in cell wall biosynthesis [Sphingomonas naasensis]TGX37969.1 glycosyltransferase [Sphingomonas naasensis]
MTPELSIVIPCYNEQENVRAICAAVTAEAARHAASHEILLIDNDSTDATRDLMRALCAEDPRIRAIFNNRNYGQMRSPTYGIYQAEGAAVIGMCADFQDPPAMIGALVAQWRAGAQIVLGQRRSERASPLLRVARGLGYAFLRRYGDYPVIPGATGFGLFDREVVDTLAAWNEPEPFFRGMLVESGFRLAIVPFDRPERAAGTSKNDFGALASFALSGLAGSAKSLLRLPIALAFVAGGIALPLLVAAILAVSLGGPGLALLGFAVGFAMFAMILLFLGLIGEQVRMLAERSRNLPLVIEAERVNFPPERARPAARTLIRRP